MWNSLANCAKTFKYIIEIFYFSLCTKFGFFFNFTHHDIIPKICNITHHVTWLIYFTLVRLIKGVYVRMILSKNSNIIPTHMQIRYVSDQNNAEIEHCCHRDMPTLQICTIYFALLNWSEVHSLFGHFVRVCGTFWFCNCCTSISKYLVFILSLLQYTCIWYIYGNIYICSILLI